MRDILIEARNLIANVGWTQNTWGTEGKCYCLYGAVSHAANLKKTTYWRAWDHVVEFAKGKLGIQSPIEWNDHPNRTRQDVIDLLDQCIGSC